jgi:hypothetical protein
MPKKVLWKVGWCRDSGELRHAYSAIAKTIERASKRDSWRRRFGGDSAWLMEYLEYLLQPVAAVIAAGRLAEHPVLADAAHLVLGGFLPVDVERQGVSERIWVAVR